MFDKIKKVIKWNFIEYWEILFLLFICALMCSKKRLINTSFKFTVHFIHFSKKIQTLLFVQYKFYNKRNSFLELND